MEEKDRKIERGYEKEVIDVRFQRSIEEYEYLKSIIETKFQELKDKYDYIRIQEGLDGVK